MKVRKFGIQEGEGGVDLCEYRIAIRSHVSCVNRGSHAEVYGAPGAIYAAPIGTGSPPRVRRGFMRGTLSLEIENLNDPFIVQIPPFPAPPGSCLAEKKKRKRKIFVFQGQKIAAQLSPSAAPVPLIKLVLRYAFLRRPVTLTLSQYCVWYQAPCRVREGKEVPSRNSFGACREINRSREIMPLLRHSSSSYR